MEYDFIREYCLAKAGAEEDYKEEWDATRYAVRGKMFALVGSDKEGVPIVSVKHDPEVGAEVRERYGDIVPGYYLNKVHWSSARLNGRVPVAVLKRLLDGSHDLIFNSLSKKVRDEILINKTDSK
ncbi:MAG: MmcQ/YjbR family DNA-binding protein [Odoribacteraceae bacterium]|jgi:predicted DNA-binding protein (MmcQ/YjbR family)|nr:MmcQ/YjbR family DNA-binding protein [Odoribacteraceae bacterium]